MEITKYIANKIKHLREKEGMTQEVLAKKLKTNRQNISRYESGERKTSQDLLFELSEIFGVTVDDFFPPREPKSNIVELPTKSSEYVHFDTAIPAGAISDIGTFLDDEFDWITLSDEVLGKYAGRSDIFITHVNGESMNNTIPDKSMIAVKQVTDAFEYEDGDIVVFRNGAGMSVKRFYNDKNEKKLVFRPDSSEKTFTDQVITYEEAEDLEIYGKVVTYVVNL